MDELLLHQPVHLRVALGSRTATSTAMTRHLAGTATVLGAEDLRFRTWEVEELFRTCHGTRLRADEVADLAQRTGGWAAGLELFHLATHGRPPSSRARLLGVGGGQLSSDYLARHVLDQVPAPAAGLPRPDRRARHAHRRHAATSCSAARTPPSCSSRLTGSAC